MTADSQRHVLQALNFRVQLPGCLPMRALEQLLVLGAPHKTIATGGMSAQALHIAQLTQKLCHVLQAFPFMDRSPAGALLRTLEQLLALGLKP